MQRGDLPKARMSPTESRKMPSSARPPSSCTLVRDGVCASRGCGSASRPQPGSRELETWGGGEERLMEGEACLVFREGA